MPWRIAALRRESIGSRRFARERNGSRRFARERNGTRRFAARIGRRRLAARATERPCREDRVEWLSG